MGIDFWEVGCSNNGTGLWMHHDGGTGQKAPPAAYLTDSRQFVEL